MFYKNLQKIDQNILTDYSIVEGTKIHLSIKKDVETDLTKELKVLGKSYVTDVDQFAIVFNQVIKEHHFRKKQKLIEKNTFKILLVLFVF